ncbi:MAG: MFS transporter [Rubricoccaceae bacterium]|nr:MFS transporter [Rubricoccaceae bacterium]
METKSGLTQSGYWELIRNNANVRRLWFGVVISLFGDWFNTLAIYRIVQDESGSPFALAIAFLTKLLPLALASPIAGVLVDRWDRRKVMIWADLVRAVLVLGFLLVRDSGDLWLLYTLASAQIVVSSVFVPAKTASLPNITTPRELLTANAFLSATWSVMLAVGAAAGGFAVDAFGTDVVFVLDSITYLISAFFIARMVIPQEKDEAPKDVTVMRAALKQITDGWHYLRENPPVMRMTWAKAAWGFGGGALVLFLALLGDTLFEGAHTTGIGILFAARGLGTGIGPVVARSLFPNERPWPLLLGLCIGITGLGYVVLSFVWWPMLIIVLVIIAHASSGANWVLSTTLLQQRSEDRFRGRVFATDWFFVTMIQSGSIVAGALLLEAGVALRAVIVIFGALQIVTGLLWTVLVVPVERGRDTAG